MGEVYGWIAGGLGVIVALVLTWLNGHSKGKTVAEQKQAEQTVEATKAAAQRETTVSREAANVDQNVNNSSDDDVNSELLNDWTRPGSR